MRDPKRIPLILARLQKVWETMPDMRLAQITAMIGRDPFYIEDNELMKIIEEKAKRANFYAESSRKAKQPQPIKGADHNSGQDDWDWPK